VKGYLQRMITRSLGDVGTAVVRPAVISRSPIAEQDQRIGMPGFEGFPSATSASIEATYKDSPVTDGYLRSQTPSPIISAENSRAAAIRRKTVDLAGSGELAAPEYATAPRVIVERGPAGEVSTDIDLYAQSPLPSRLVGEAAIGSQNYVTAAQQDEPANSGAGIIAPDASEQATPSSQVNAQAAITGARPPRSAEAGPPLLEPSPRSLTSPRQRESPSSDDGDSVGRFEQRPRVVIGHINVEVVHTPTESKTSTTSRRGPLTAASVSVIGPLKRGARSDMRLSLRHR
jgi:hypothetical protein